MPVIRPTTSNLPFGLNYNADIGSDILSICKGVDDFFNMFQTLSPPSSAPVTK